MLWLDRYHRLQVIRKWPRWSTSQYAAIKPTWQYYLQQPSLDAVTVGAQGLAPQLRCFTVNSASAARVRGTSHLNESVDGTSGGIHISQIGPQIARSGGVRDYLRQWSADYQKDQKDNAPSQVTLGRNTLLPNSLFVRDTVPDDTPVGEDEENFEGEDEYDSGAFSPTYQLVPGDAFIMTSRKVKKQFALYLGHVGAQGQYLLADGRWYVAVRTVFAAHMIHNFATEHEMAVVRAHLPVKPVGLAEAEGEGQSFVRAFGEVPYEASSPLLTRFAILKEEGEEFRRDNARALEQLYDKIASESEVRRFSLQQLVHQQLHTDYDLLNDGSKIYLLDKLSEEPRVSVAFARQRFYIVTLPKQMVRGAREVTDWARAYQDAAARAASGKDVSQDLQKNPLTNFISKARRIITQSRKIRAPTPEGQLGPTLGSALPPKGGIVRRPTGESFDDEEKKIVQFLWCTHFLRPFLMSPAQKRNSSICSMILRAVGAYPRHYLTREIGKLFLQELGCLEPWAISQDHNADLPLTWLGLNEAARLASEKQQAAMAQLDFQPDTKEPPFPDSMAHLRKDWGALDVFCVDSRTTRVVDDGISVEVSKEIPGHYWLHVHVAHPSAFIPSNHPLHEKPLLMGGTAYSYHRAEQCYPHELTDTLSVRPGGAVMTVSTLLAPDGAVKDIQVVPGIVRNVHHINGTMLPEILGTEEPVVRELIVGQRSGFDERDARQSTKDTEVEDYEAQQMLLISTHLKKFELIRDLVAARWEARKRENPGYLRMARLTPPSGDVYVHLPEPPNLNYQRIFKSEHWCGDPWIRVTSSKVDLDQSYDEQPRKYDPLAGSMFLAAESIGAWTRRRGIPAIYRYQSCRPGYDIDKLNSLGQHEGYLSLASGESVSPSPYYMLNMAQMLPYTNPLRSVNDLINHYQVDAYLKARAETATSGERANMQVNYPRSREELLRQLREGANYKDLSMTDSHSKKHWTSMALFRAFHFGEAPLPEIFDVQVGNPVRIGKERDDLTVTLVAFGLSADLLPSEQGWEKLAKFRQFLPVKLKTVDVTNGVVTCVAVGPPTNTPRIKDFAYPELRPRSRMNIGTEESASGQLST